jgi:6-phosphogluconolactonase
MTFTAFPSRDEAMAAAAQRISDALQRGIAERRAGCAALSGGSTPGPAYTLLAKQSLDWSKVTFALVDERAAPPDDPASNEGLLRRTLAPALAHGATLAPLYAATPAAPQIADTLYAPLTVDIALMGMGEDGHTASWFPNGLGLTEALDPDSRRIVIQTFAKNAPGSAVRFTLTRAAIMRARSVVLLITGENKRDVLERALSGPIEDMPVAALFTDPSRQPEVIWAP